MINHRFHIRLLLLNEYIFHLAFQQLEFGSSMHSIQTQKKIRGAICNRWRHFLRDTTERAHLICIFAEFCCVQLLAVG